MMFPAMVFLFLFTYKIMVNISCLMRICYYEKKYSIYTSNYNAAFSEYSDAVVQLFKTAGIAEPMIPYIQQAGFGFVRHGYAPLFSNTANLSSEAIEFMNQCFQRARGTFRRRIIEAFSPIYWLDCVINLPRKTFEYLGLNGDSLAVRVVQILYWLIAPFMILFRDWLYQYVLLFFR